MDTKNYTDYRSQHTLLTEPMSQKELRDNVRKDGTVQVQVLVSFEKVLANDIDWLNDEVSEMITGSIAGLTEISFDLVGSVTGTNEIIIKITGTPEIED